MPDIPAPRDVPAGPPLAEGWLTQYGTDWFREKPRFEIEYDVSALRGRLSLEQTTMAILGRSPAVHHRHRHFDTARLWAEEYRCLHTGSARKPDHASILAACPDADIEAHKAWWNDPGRVALSLIAESGV